MKAIERSGKTCLANFEEGRSRIKGGEEGGMLSTNGPSLFLPGFELKEEEKSKKYEVTIIPLKLEEKRNNFLK